MALAFVAMTVLLGSSLVVAFVMPPKKDHQGGPTVDPIYDQHRCQRDELPSIRRSLLRALNLQVEPQLPMGQLAPIREQWKHTFSAIGHRSKGSAPSDNSPEVAPGVGNSTDLKCCQLVSQISLEDLGWDNWVIYPESFRVVQCAPCDPNNVRCLANTPSAVNDSPSQLQCCEPTSKETVPVVYMDELSSLVISSAALTRACGCGPGNTNKE
ncbi:Bone morphogenetic protein 5 [Merluccius polli]|uniref:Bone morphogenetic protein 5 n=1 Tax=Merluccius polli TaxID=89951 RepID=A0AA47MJL8_MERPO|nr:Bone morphogenetic protein 5 [Merluccius polli]